MPPFATPRTARSARLYTFGVVPINGLCDSCVHQKLIRNTRGS